LSCCKAELGCCEHITMNSILEHISHRVALLILLSFVLGGIYLATFWPGIATPDTLWQYTQASTGRYDDWHPVLMAFLWSFLQFPSPSTSGYLVFQVTLLCVGFLLVAHGLYRAGFAHGWLIFTAGLIPQVWVFAGVLWKDVLLAAFFLCSVGALLN